MSLKIISQYFRHHKINQPFDYKFTIEQSGIYLIEVTARAKDWQQNGALSFLKVDNLRIEIDDTKFPKFKKKGLFNTPACWNGNQLKNLKKTVVIILHLEKGQHSCKFIPQQTPFLEYACVYRVTNKKQIVFQPKIHTQAEEGNRRPFYTFVIKDIPFQGFSISASAKDGEQYPTNQRDDDDLQLKIDDNRINNDTPKSHKYWYWCGKILKGKSKTFAREMCFTPNLHYLELLADRSPIIQEARFFLKRIPTIDDPKWTGDFNDDTNEMILARVIFGEARGISKKAKAAVAWTVRNRIKDKRWPNTYHDVILQPKQYSAFNKNDENLPYVKDPLHSGLSLDKKRWLESYEVAQQVIKGELEDPTDGANHYYSDFINPPDWAKNPEAQFKIKIDNTLFYDIKSTHKAGRIKLSLLLLIFLIITLLTIGISFAFTRNKIPLVEEQITSKVKGLEYPSSKYYFIHPIWNEVVVMSFDQNGNYYDLQQLTNDGYHKSHLSEFSEGGLIGYFQELHKVSDTYIDENEESRKQYYDNYIALMIMKEGEEPYEVYRGDYHTSDWEWFSYYQIRLTSSCGSGCHLVKTINIDTKEVEAEDIVYYKSYDNKQE